MDALVGYVALRATALYYVAVVMVMVLERYTIVAKM